MTPALTPPAIPVGRGSQCGRTSACLGQTWLGGHRRAGVAPAQPFNGLQWALLSPRKGIFKLPAGSSADTASSDALS